MAKRRGRERPPEFQQVLDVAGGVAALAQLLKLSPARMTRWRTIPAEYAVEIEAKLGVVRERARPDQAFTRRAP
jgi:DNA-binding transcriptional regulator YdaS (Cro superfamily)